MPAHDDDLIRDLADAFAELDPPPGGLGTLRRTLPGRLARRTRTRRLAISTLATLATIALALVLGASPRRDPPATAIATAPSPRTPSLVGDGPGHPALDPPPGEPAVLRGPGSLVRVPTSRPDVVLYDLR